jgi:hypothetical protein
MWKRKADISLSRTQQVVVRVCFLLFHAIEPEASERHHSDSDIKIVHLRSQLMIADLLTKSVNGNFFNSLRAGLLGD